MMGVTSNLYESKEYSDIREVIKDGINRYPDCVAFTIKNKEGKDIQYTDITYAEFEKEINSLGTGLLKLGLKDKKIAIIGPNSYEWVLSYISVLFGIGIVVPLDKGLPAQEIEDSIIRSDADALIFDPKYIDIIEDIKQRSTTKVKEFICMKEVESKEINNIPKIKKIGKEELDKGNKEFFELKIEPEKTSIILFTSGTTSLSKAVMLSQKNIASNVHSMNAAEKLYNTDVNLVMLPFHHTFGSTGIILMLNNGVRNVFCDGLRHIQENMKEYKVSVFVCVPLILEAMHKRILLEVKKQGKEKTINRAKKLSNALLKVGIDVRKKLFKQLLDKLGGNMRFVVSGAAAIDKQVAEDFNSWGILTIQGYGLTETSPVLCAENEKCLKLGSVGIPLIDVEVKIDNPNEKGIGEIIAKGPNVMLGYYKNEEATKNSLIDGWYHTGDLGYIDRSGYLFITGRKKNVIVLKNGKNIYPEEIEMLLKKNLEIKECMVYGKAQENSKELTITARVIPNLIEIEQKYGKDSLTDEKVYDVIWKIIKETNKELTSYKAIKKLEIKKDDFEMTTTMKIKRYKELQKDKS